jgi:hypothetical protein
MPTDGTGQDRQGQAGGLLSDPRWLAAGAGGLSAACLALWAFHGLTFGPLGFWLAPLPLFLAGLGFGPLAGLGAAAIGGAALWLDGVDLGLWLFLLGFGIPAALLVAASRGGRVLGLPLVLLGLLPAAGIAVAAFWLADMPGGLEGTLAAMAQASLSRFDLPASAVSVSDVVRVKAAAIGICQSLALAGNGWLAGRLLARFGIAPAPAWSAARLPGWYALLPALAFGLWLAAGDEGDAVELSMMLVLLLPLMLHGLAVLHTRTRGRGERPLLLGAVYVSLLILFLPASLAVAGYGAFDLLLRPRDGRATPPSRS